MFDGTLADRSEVFSIDSAIAEVEYEADQATDSIKRGSSAVPTPTPTPPRKRAGSQLAAHRKEKHSKKISATDRLGQRIGDIADQLGALTEAVAVDDQKAAVGITVKTFKNLDPTLLLAVLEEFATDYKAKTFVSLPPALQKRWVKTALERRSGELSGGVYNNGKTFQEAIDEVDWE